MLRVTVGFISVSDAAPLPRLGEVFFDVRGNSRSMRLSWYADTGVAVFSIWQAGMCTGTFRLPIGDLSRMIETLERGPSGHGRAPVSAPRRGPDPGAGAYLPAEDEIGLLDADSVPGGPAGYAGADYAPDYGTSGRSAGHYGQGGFDGRPSAPGDRDRDRGGRERGPAGRGASRGYDAGGTADFPAADYGTAGYGETYSADGSLSDGYPPAGYPADGVPADGRVGGASRPRGADYGAGGYQPADYGAGGPDDGHDAGSYGYQPDEYSRGYADDDLPGRGGHADADYATRSYPAPAADYLTGEQQAPGFHDGTRARGGPDYGSGGYGSEPDFPPSGRRRDDSRFPPNTGGFPPAETDGTGYQEERFVPPYVQGSDESYRHDNHSGPARHDGDPDDAGYPADMPPVPPSDGYQEPRWPDEAYSHGTEYRRR